MFTTPSLGGASEPLAKSSAATTFGDRTGAVIGDNRLLVVVAVIVGVVALVFLLKRP